MTKPLADAEKGYIGTTLDSFLEQQGIAAEAEAAAASRVATWLRAQDRAADEVVGTPRPRAQRNA